MNESNSLRSRFMLGFGIALLVVSTGCIVPGGGGYGGDVEVGGPPDLYVFGGGYDRGRDVHAYSQRGYTSRAVAHPEEGHAVAHSDGGHESAPHGGGQSARR
jgi:hypothetical protein